MTSRNLPNESFLYEDCVKEKPDIVAQAEDFGKACSATIVKVLKKIVLDR